MDASPRAIAFWSRWLLVVMVGTMIFGLFMLLAPQATRHALGLFYFADAGRLDRLGPEAVAYIDFLHGILGAVTFGWGMALAWVVRSLFARGDRTGWRILAASTVAWFVPDVGVSLHAGLWQNALADVAFALLIALPLAATYGAFRRPDKAEAAIREIAEAPEVRR